MNGVHQLVHSSPSPIIMLKPFPHQDHGTQLGSPLALLRMESHTHGQQQSLNQLQPFGQLLLFKNQPALGVQHYKLL